MPVVWDSEVVVAVVMSLWDLEVHGVCSLKSAVHLEKKYA
jgi:hypothetical protein